MGCDRLYRLLVVGVAGLIFLASTIFSQQTSAPQGAAVPEIATQEAQPGFTLKARINEVLVRVVVRDAKGRAVPDLHQEDFEITDNRKPQKITGFSVEAHPRAISSPGQPANAVPAKGAQGQAAPSPPTAYLVLFFDDLNSAQDSVMRGRQAAEKFIADLPPTERIAVFTSSGTPFLDFTADRQKLHEALSKLRSNVRGGRGPACPEITDYVANQIVSFATGSDDTALLQSDAVLLVRDEAINDCHMDARMVTPQVIRGWAEAAYGAYQVQARAVFDKLESAVQNLAKRPGDRQLMVVSDGFMTFDSHGRLERVIDEALHRRVIISSLDGKGLAVVLSEGDASRRGALPGNLAGLYARYGTARQVADTATLEEMADGTGGLFVHDTNDLLGGFQRALTPPETDYILTFSPEDLKADGALHTLKVSLKNGHGFSVQARKGYYAPSAPPATELAATGGTQEAVPATPPAPPAAPPSTDLVVTAPTQGAVVTAPPTPPAAPSAAVPEIATQEAQPGFTLKARINEVLVRVVVRDAQGKGVASLTKDDFRLLDNGKAQTIRQFSVETGQPTAVAPEAPLERSEVERTLGEAKPATAPGTRFVGLYFDDTFLSIEDVVRTQKAAAHYLHTSIRPGDRVGLFTSSGQGNVEFTNDVAALEEALAKLSPHPRGISADATGCINFSAYQSFLMAEKEDSQALELGKNIVIKCLCGGPMTVAAPPGAQSTAVYPCTIDPQLYAQQTARSIWERTRYAVTQSLSGLTGLVRRMGTMPGQRTIVWISPGFLDMEDAKGLSSVIDQALRARVVINALDSRGLLAIVPGGDVTQQGVGLIARYNAEDTQYVRTELQMDTDVMVQATSGTGGVFFENSNDFEAGFRVVGGLPEVAYLLSFSPENLKYDGKFHKLTVQLAHAQGFSVQARKGYFAPSEEPNAERAAKEDLQDAVFSGEERKDLPLEVQTQFFMTTETDGRLSVESRVDLHGVHLRKEQQRNIDELTMVTALFDDNGNLLEGQEKIVNLHLQDATLNNLLGRGLRVVWQFKVKPGTYVVREVVRDAANGGIASLSRTVEIPYSQ